MPADTTVLVLDPERARTRAHDLVATSEEFLGRLVGRGRRRRHRPDRPRRCVLPRDRRRPAARPRPRPRVVDGQPLRHRHRRRARRRRRRACRAGRCPRTPPRPTAATSSRPSTTSAAGSTDGRRRRRSCTPATARPSGSSSCSGRTTSPPASSRRATPPAPNVVTVTCGHLVHGLVDDEAQVAVVTGDDLSGQKTSTRDMRRMPARRKKQIDPLELKAGDYVVHEQHGVGRFVEMKQREIGGAVREYLVLEYGAQQARRAQRHALRPGRHPRPGHPLRRRREPQPRPARRRRLDQAQEQGAPRGPRDRGRADQALRRPAGDQGPRLRPRHPVAARARGRLPVHRDRRPADHRRRGQGRHAPGRADGPAGLRRRRLRQDRDRGAGGVQGGAGRQAGRRAGADDAARHPAPVDVLRADDRLPGRRSRGSRASRPTRRPRRSSPASATGRSTSSSAPTACSTPTSRSRTSA